MLEILLGSIICFPFILPFIGVGIIEAYQEDKPGRFAGFFILKQLIDNLLWFPIVLIYFNVWGNFQALNLFVAIIILIIPFILTISIIYSFRYLFKNNFLSWTLLVGDILCWIARFLYYNNIDNGKGFIGEASYLLLALYPVLVLIILLARHYSLKRKPDSKLV